MAQKNNFNPSAPLIAGWKKFEIIINGLVKSLILDGGVKSSRSRLAQFRRMQSAYLYVKF